MVGLNSILCMPVSLFVWLHVNNGIHMRVRLSPYKDTPIAPCRSHFSLSLSLSTSLFLHTHYFIYIAVMINHTHARSRSAF